MSNHGGRQLDSAPASISVLPEIASAVGSRTEILLDGGIRTGRTCSRRWRSARGLPDRPLVALWPRRRGQGGVTQVLEILRKELDTSMALAGLTDVRSVTPAALHTPRRV